MSEIARYGYAYNMSTREPIEDKEGNFVKYEDHQAKVIKLEKLLIEAHFLRFDSYLSCVQEFNERNIDLLELLKVKHADYLNDLEKGGEE